MCNYITGQACRHVCADVRDLWKLFAPKLEMLATGGFDSSKGQVDKAEILALLHFFAGLKDEAAAYLEWAQSAYQPRRVKISADLDASVDLVDIKSYIAKFSGDGDDSYGDENIQDDNVVADDITEIRGDEDEDEDE